MKADGLKLIKLSHDTGVPPVTLLEILGLRDQCGTYCKPMVNVHSPRCNDEQRWRQTSLPGVRIR